MSCFFSSAKEGPMLMGLSLNPVLKGLYYYFGDFVSWWLNSNEILKEAADESTIAGS
jgi:hypothetical protein